MFNRQFALSLSPIVKARTPRTFPPHRYRLTLQTREPVTQSRNGHRGDSSSPTLLSVSAGLMGVAQRIGLASLRLPSIAVENLTTKLSTITIRAGGKFARGSSHQGIVVGWEGYLSVDTNAVGAWLGLIAGSIGYGSLTSIGFGRVRATVEVL